MSWRWRGDKVENILLSLRHLHHKLWGWMPPNGRMERLKDSPPETIKENQLFQREGSSQLKSLTEIANIKSVAMSHMF
jgi:hypothetical protein